MRENETLYTELVRCVSGGGIGRRAERIDFTHERRGTFVLRDCAGTVRVFASPRGARSAAAGVMDLPLRWISISLLSQSRSRAVELRGSCSRANEAIAVLRLAGGAMHFVYLLRPTLAKLACYGRSIPRALAHRSRILRHSADGGRLAKTRTWIARP